MPETLVHQLKDPAARKALAEALHALFDEWALPQEDRTELLAWPGLGPEAPLPQDAGVLERAGHLLAIGRALRRAYPYQPHRRGGWVSLPEPALGGASPLQLMLAEGLKGICRVRELIESEQ
ncbi:MAG: DUF2384 domain-containing protein [Gammaproteobacteria bacterium]|nr:DUF2384 domain-containing protein [Gammaproteobacteria bacterium]NIR28458.1 DUF2384 domain-containing protein [Gammaproteobacteria bacterium]NIR96904.1 DUF2384 domain-containing protein [Gammaproteobacteria bacterium]NIT62605.1 DUF2384 domain-containing protein [Gammaproteobacteria bacterium]NIV19562.1 DUF2384 domain-containing protein [Gammaproteobacteria bacterium]